MRVSSLVSFLVFELGCAATKPQSGPPFSKPYHAHARARASELAKAKCERVVPGESDAPELKANGAALPWIRNDARQAFAYAKRSNRSVFVDLSASWCHTCEHLDTTVFVDPALKDIRDDVVWLSIDVDAPQNEPFLRAHAYEALPTLLVMGPDGAERSRWVGSLDAAELRAFVKTGKAGSPLIADATKASLAHDWPSVLRIAESPSHDPCRSLWERLVLATLVLDAKAELKTSDVNGDDSRDARLSRSAANAYRRHLFRV
jgi:Thioredoxin-like